MNDDLDLEPFADIGDPFAESARAPAPPLDSKSLGRSLTRARARAWRGGALAVALLLEAAFLVFKERRPDLASLSAPQIALGLAVPLVAAALALVAVVRSGKRGLGLSAAGIGALAVAAPAVFAIGTLLAAPAGGEDPHFWLHAAGCMTVSAILAVGPMALGLWAYRHAFVAAAPWRTAAIGLAAGSLAAATMSLACPISTASHVILGHGVVMLMAALAGALLAPAVARS